MPTEPKSEFPDAEKPQFFYEATPTEERLIKIRILLSFYLTRAAKVFQALKNRLWVA